ncbi:MULTISPECIES: 50S ribosomal protein L6 [unclassified Veillonella]|jgi:ribosomal protein L6|uniref:50S ribosomal protein L6 n=1 Tax=unclassified Veillonella TaxID=2630086 RepID=UPI00021A1CE2|nr:MULTISPECIES: 50S ribosomal protein L6 [unclassified Veillonella]EGS33647.1 ribosomal protein L6 [Veillonella sp. oral taxon 780 str. F0422]
MSRVGRMPIEIPAGVTVSQNENTLTVKGAKGELTRTFHPDINIAVEENVITVTRPSDGKEHRSLHGLTRALVANMVTGVHEGFTKTLEINGVGYRAAKQGNKLALTLGFSHPVEMEAPAGITIDVPAPNKIVVSGADKEVVGAVAADIRKWRKPEPYKGKGIRYEGEVVRRKAGKAGAKGK